MPERYTFPSSHASSAVAYGIAIDSGQRCADGQGRNHCPLDLRQVFDNVPRGSTCLI
ncbi:hypothetical protein RHECNPAF_122100154 [Rhizobium etli CNPAF512]|nr:hypothetical protein RHECNPAF_122100154 [Rhizobium etli CNPAF512]